MTTTLRSMSQNLNVKVFVKVFKTTLNPNLVTDLIHLLYDDTYWSTFLRSTNPQHPRSCQGQEHRLRILMLKFYTKVFRISLLLNYTMDLVPIWYKDRYCPPPPPPHTHTHTHTHTHSPKSCQNQGHGLRIFQKQNVQYQASYPVW